MRDDEEVNIPKSWRWVKSAVSGKESLPPYMREDGLPVSDKELVRLHITENLSASEIARRIKVNPRFVRARLRILDSYQKNRRPLRRDDLDIKHMVFLYRLGFSPREIAEVVEASSGTVRRHLKRAGVYSPSSSKNPTHYVKRKIESGMLPEEALLKFSKNKRMRERAEEIIRRRREQWQGKK